MNFEFRFNKTLFLINNNFLSKGLAVGSYRHNDKLVLTFQKRKHEGFDDNIFEPLLHYKIMFVGYKFSSS